MLSLVTGSKVESATGSDGYIHVIDKLFDVVGGEVDLGVKTAIKGAAATLVASDFIVIDAATNEPATFTLDVADANAILAVTGGTTQVSVTYKKVDTEISMAAILKCDVPFYVSIVHQGKFLQKDGKVGGVETELYKCRAKGTFSIDTSRNTASTNVLNLEVVDPERSDNRLGVVKRFQVDSFVCGE
jgi:hypothetical protein